MNVALIQSCYVIVRTEKSKTQILGQPAAQKPRVKNIFLEHILTPIQNLVSSLPNRLNIGVKMTSKTIFLPLVSRLSSPRFWVLVFLCVCNHCMVHFGHIMLLPWACGLADNSNLNHLVLRVYNLSPKRERALMCGVGGPGPRGSPACSAPLRCSCLCSMLPHGTAARQRGGPGRVRVACRAASVGSIVCLRPGRF